MSDTAIRADLDWHLQVEIGKVLTRHLAIARTVLEPTDVLLLLINAAVGLSISAAASVGHNVDESRREELITATLRQISAAITSDRAIAKIRTAAATGQGDIW